MQDLALFQTELIEISVFSIDPIEPQFTEAGFVKSPIIVFPKKSIWIEHEGGDRFVADPTLVNFYNQGQSYQRYEINPSGDLCHCFRINDDLLSQVTSQEVPHFNVPNVRCSASVFTQHMQLLRQLNEGIDNNTMAIEEQVIHIFHELLVNDDSLGQGFGQQFERQRRLVEQIKASIDADLSVNLSLNQLAQIHHMSPYHLSRVFKKHTGQGINQYRTENRLRSLIFELPHRKDDWVNLALDYGFSSHSHMTASFKKMYGMSPSDWLNSH